MTQQPERGCVVAVTAGRDRGRLLTVLRTGDGGIWLADGKRRKLEHPKKKNPRHIAATAWQVTESSMVTNRELRRALARLTAEFAAAANGDR